MVFVYLLIAVAHVHLRKTRERANIPAPPLRMWLFPWADYLAIGGMLAILIAMEFIPARARELNVSLIPLAAAGDAYMFLKIRRRGESATQ